MDATTLGMLACRGAAELPSDPHAAIRGMRLPDPKKVRLTRKQKEAAMIQASAMADVLRYMYGAH